MKRKSDGNSSSVENIIEYSPVEKDETPLPDEWNLSNDVQNAVDDGMHRYWCESTKNKIRPLATSHDSLQGLNEEDLGPEDEIFSTRDQIINPL